MSMGKNKKMKNIIMLRIKKWTMFILIGTFAYFIGYVWGQKMQRALISTEKVFSKSQK